MLTAPDFMKKQIIFVFFNEGEKMSVQNDNIIVKDKDGKVKLQITCYRIFIIFAVGNCSFTSYVLQRAARFGFFIACMSSGFRLYSVIGFPKDGNTLLKKKQYEMSSLEMGKRIVYNKIMNQQNELKQIRDKSDSVKEALTGLGAYMESLANADSLQAIMAYEGLAAKLYFRNHFNNALWNGRQPRIKRDYINSTLDVGYTILFAFVDAILQCYGFDTYVGVLHRQFYMRKSLVCDIVEPFRVMIDHQVKKGINLKQIKEDDFACINGQYRLKYDCSPRYVRMFMTPLLEYRDDIFRYINGYYYAFMKGAGAQSFPLFLWRGENGHNKL